MSRERDPFAVVTSRLPHLVRLLHIAAAAISELSYDCHHGLGG
jgi:hypothetical protein